MNHKILLVVMITLCFAQFSKQDNAIVARPVSRVAGAPAYGWHDWNHDGT